MTLTHRDRVQIALAHQEPDRVPLDLGGTQTSILVEPYNALKQALGISTPTEIQNITLGLARVEPAVLERFGIDFCHIRIRPPDTWSLTLLPDDSFYDQWGTRWHRPPGGHYYDMVEYPLAAATLDSLATYHWPDPDNSGRIAGVAEEARKLRRDTDYAIETGFGGLWEGAWFLVGFQQWLLSLSDNPEFVEGVLDGVLSVQKRMYGRYLKEVGEYVDLVTLWDDYGAQNGPLISPVMWRRLVKPRLADLVATLKSHTRACIGLHCCGALRPILDDLVEVGIQVLNPVQVSARGMIPAELKARYGKALSFWGGIDTQHLLPHGTPSDVAQAASATLRALGPGGGYILAAVHNIQPGVPAENIIAMYDTARTTGLYPLQG